MAPVRRDLAPQADPEALLTRWNAGRAGEDAAKGLIRCAHHIWEDKAIGLVYDRYQHNVRVHTALGEHYGREEVVAEAVRQLAAFPDCRLRGDAVIWDDGRGLYVSYRTTRVAYNTGHSVFGPPTGKRVRCRTVTDYLAQGEHVAEVWEVHDGLALARQLGLGVREAVAALARQHFIPLASPGTGALERLRGQEPPDARPRPTPGDGVEGLVRWAWHEIWNRRRLDRIGQLYAPDYLFFGPSSRRFRLRNDFTAYVLSLLAAFPDAVVQVERLTCVGNSEDGAVSVRWRLSGTHDGHGPYGSPTGRRVNILGITHQHLRGGKFSKEWTVFDELALLAQLHVQDGVT